MDRVDPPARPWMSKLGIPLLRLSGVSVRLAAWPVRRADFAAFVEETGHDATTGMLTIGHDDADWSPHGHTWQEPGFPQAADHPVVGVNHDDAQAFCAWLTDHERASRHLGATHAYRLPTDLEWSAAIGLRDDADLSPEARFYHDPGVYPWGVDWPPPPDFGNYSGEESREGMPAWWGVAPGGYRDAFPRTSPVGSFAPNALGFYDLSGNVWEWCLDAYCPGGMARVIRGGSWSSDRPAYLRSANRIGKFPDARTDEIGFRIALAAA